MEMVNSLNLWCDFGPPFLFYPRFPFLLKRKKPENYRLQFSFILILERGNLEKEVKEIILFDFRSHFFISFLFPFPFPISSF